MSSARKPLTEGSVFENLYLFLINIGVQSRDAVIFMHLHGLDGGIEESLRKTAANYNISAERVRQISSAVEEDVNQNQKKSSELKDSLSVVVSEIKKLIPNTDSNISKVLREQGLIGESDLASSVVNIANMFGMGAMRIDNWLDERALVQNEMPRCFKSVISEAKKIASASGVITPLVLVDFLEKKSVFVSLENAESMIKPFSTMIATTRYKNRQANWYAFPINSDLLIRAKNLMGSLGHCTVSHLCQVDTITRSRFYFEAPEVVIGKYLQHEGFKVENGNVTSEEVLTNRLSDIQGRMVDIMKRIGQTTTQKQFLSECVKAGINATTAKVYLYRSSLFKCFDGYCELAV